MLPSPLDTSYNDHEYNTERPLHYLFIFSLKMKTTIILVFTSCSFALASNTTDPGYNCIPHQSCWPTTAEWQAFNQSINGHLHATVPLAAPCFLGSPYYNVATCINIAAQYLNG